MKAIKIVLFNLQKLVDKHKKYYAVIYYIRECLKKQPNEISLSALRRSSQFKHNKNKSYYKV